MRYQIRQALWQLDMTILPNVSNLLYLVLFLCRVAGKTTKEQIGQKQLHIHMSRFYCVDRHWIGNR